jgi:hypothetical protein
MIHRLRNTTNTYVQTQPAAACLLVGFRQQFAVTGLSLAFELLLAGLQRRHIPYRLVDLGPGSLFGYCGSSTANSSTRPLSI